MQRYWSYFRFIPEARNVIREGQRRVGRGRWWCSPFFGANGMRCDISSGCLADLLHFHCLKLPRRSFFFCCLVAYSYSIVSANLSSLSFQKEIFHIHLKNKNSMCFLERPWTSCTNVSLITVVMFKMQLTGWLKMGLLSKQSRNNISSICTLIKAGSDAAVYVWLNFIANFLFTCAVLWCESHISDWTNRNAVSAETKYLRNSTKHIWKQQMVALSHYCKWKNFKLYRRK